MRRGVGLVAVIATVAGCAKVPGPTMEPAEAPTYRTADGWELPLRHYPGEGPPVLLVHGMAANTRNWDYRDETSFIPELQAAGFDVWVPALRGDPGAEHPSRRASRSFTFDDHARYDLPAAVDAVLATTGERDLLWVGHSMGGMLLYTAVSHYPDKVRAGIAIASPGVFDNPLKIHHAAAKAKWLVSGPGLLPMRALGRTALDLGMRRMLERRVASEDSLDASLLRGMVRHVLNPIPRAMARQATDWLRTGTLSTADGTPWLKPSDVPLLVMAGSADGIVSERDAAATCDLFADCTYQQLSVASGLSHDYGHVDPVIGLTAHEEILPRVIDFLAAHARPPQDEAVPVLVPDEDLAGSEEPGSPWDAAPEEAR